MLQKALWRSRLINDESSPPSSPPEHAPPSRDPTQATLRLPSPPTVAVVSLIYYFTISDRKRLIQNPYPSGRRYFMYRQLPRYTLYIQRLLLAVVDIFYQKPPRPLPYSRSRKKTDRIYYAEWP